MIRNLCLCLCMGMLFSPFSLEGKFGGKGEDVMLRILQEEPTDRIAQKRVKAWEKEAGFSAALETYRKKEAAYQETMREWKAALKDASPDRAEKLTRLSRQADRLWEEKVQSFVKALQVKTKSLQREQKHRILEADSEKAVILKPVSQ